VNIVGNVKLVSGKGSKRGAQRRSSGTRVQSSRTSAGNAAGARAGTGTGTSASNPVRTNGSSGARSGASPNARPNPGPDSRPNSRPNKKKRTRSGAKAVLIILIILLIGIGALIVSLGFYVDNLDTVYPNVWADGVKLSDLTLEEARMALINAGYESNAENIFVTVSFPDDSKYTISGEEVGLSLNAGDAAIAAYQVGRGGSFYDNGLAYVKSYFNKTELHDLSIATLDETPIRELAAEYTKRFNDAIIDDMVEITDESITIVKGTGVKPADEDEVFDLTLSTLKRAMEEKAHLTVEYFPEETAVKELDLEFLYESITVDPVSSVYDPETFTATESSPGISFDMAEAQVLLDNARMGSQVVIPLITLEPEVLQWELESMLFRDELAKKTTNIGGTSNRLNNIQLATEAINGTKLNPGDVFSFNGLVGQRTAARGYKEANAYVGGEVVQEIGGGICQVSSTTYNCVLHTDLEVVERKCHRFTVSYLPYGQDATVNWGSIDFKFKNNTDYPIRVDASVNGRELTVKLIGTKLNDNYIEVDYVHISTTPAKTVEREDPSVPPGKRVTSSSGHTGHVVDTYKNLYDKDGNLISRTLVGRSSYSASDKIILIPVGSDTDTETSETPRPTDPSPSSPPPTTEPTTSPPTESPTTPADTSPSDPPPSTPDEPDD